eukprot:1681357-Prymnesium_polylepis.1
MQYWARHAARPTTRHAPESCGRSRSPMTLILHFTAPYYWPSRTRVRRAGARVIAHSYRVPARASRAWRGRSKGSRHLSHAE